MSHSRVPQVLDRRLALELARVTERAAVVAARFRGRGDEQAADEAALEAAHGVLAGMAIKGRVVIGEGLEGEVPHLFLGEEVGAGGDAVDLAVDPLEGATLCAKDMAGSISVVVLAAPVVRDMAKSLKLSPKRFLMPLSHVTVMGGLLTLIGTSTNLLVNDMARNAGQPSFGLFEITGVGLSIAVVGGAYLYFFGARMLDKTAAREEAEMAAKREAQGGGMKRRFWPFALPKLGEQRATPSGSGDAVLGDVDLYEKGAERPLELKRALASLVVFVSVVAVAAFGLAPIAASAFAGAVALILMRIITAEEAYAGLRPEILLLIAGMVVIGSSLEVTGLAQAGADALIDVIRPYGPWVALFIF
jgi:hypothetical protein